MAEKPRTSTRVSFFYSTFPFHYNSFTIKKPSKQQDPSDEEDADDDVLQNNRTNKSQAKSNIFAQKRPLKRLTQRPDKDKAVYDEEKKEEAEEE